MRMFNFITLIDYVAAGASVRIQAIQTIITNYEVFFLTAKEKKS